MANNPQLLDRLPPHTLGAIWIGEKALDLTTPGFSELNYVFDGLISQTIHQYSNEQKSNQLSFFTKNFGENFFLYYFMEKIKFPIVVPIMPTNNRNTILIINSTNKKIQIDTFEKNLPGFKFELLDVI